MSVRLFLFIWVYERNNQPKIALIIKPQNMEMGLKIVIGLDLVKYNLKEWKNVLIIATSFVHKQWLLILIYWKI